MPIQCSTSITHPTRLALKLFRGEQAISKFVWHITPTHSSSHTFATVKGSALHEGLASLQPDHGWLTWFRVYSLLLCPMPSIGLRPIQTRFPYGSGCACLNLATKCNSLAHSPKGTPSHFHPVLDATHGALTACKRSVSDSLSLPLPGFFSPFPHGTCSLSVVKSI